VHGDPRDAGKGRDARRQERFSMGGKPLYHYMGWLVRFQLHGTAGDRGREDPRDAPFDKVCSSDCGVTTGIGAVINTAKVEPGANVVVFGLGASA